MTDDRGSLRGASSFLDRPYHQRLAATGIPCAEHLGVACGELPVGGLHIGTGILFQTKTVVAMDLIELAPIGNQPASDFLACKLIYKCLGYLQEAEG